MAVFAGFVSFQTAPRRPRMVSRRGREEVMKRGVLLKSGAGVVVVALGGFVGWILTLPPAPAATGAPPIDSREEQAMLDALTPPKRPRPVVAVVGINDATEPTGRDR